MTREDALALAAQHDIDLFRVIRRAGRKDRDKAKAVSLYLAETIIAEAAAMRERADKALGDAKWKVGGVSIDAMEGDNLAVTLCSRFDDPDGEQDENGWTEAAVDGCDATLAAIHAVYVDALARALPATGEVGRG